MLKLGVAAIMVLGAVLGACGNDADDIGVGAQCTMNNECNQDDGAQTCLPFKGGYCGLQGCTKDADCPDASACVHHSDNMNYCFRICVDKPDCNANRDPANEANCSSSVDFVEGKTGVKACVPPT
jgi:hypothetical protein